MRTRRIGGAEVLLAPQPFVKIPQVGVQLLRIRFASLAVNACRPILAGEAVGFSQQLLVDQVSQCREHPGLVDRLLRNPLKFR
jgi:hypothetical protein